MQRINYWCGSRITSKNWYSVLDWEDTILREHPDLVLRSSTLGWSWLIILRGVSSGGACERIRDSMLLIKWPRSFSLTRLVLFWLSFSISRSRIRIGNWQKSSYTIHSHALPPVQEVERYRLVGSMARDTFTSPLNCHFTCLFSDSPSYQVIAGLMHRPRHWYH